MKNTVLALYVCFMGCLAMGQDSTNILYMPKSHCYYVNLGMGATLTYNSNGLVSGNGGLNYVYKGLHYISAQTQFGFGIKALTQPNRVGSFTHYQLLYGLRQHVNKGRFVTPFMGFSYSTYNVSTYEYKDIELGPIAIQQELFYEQETKTSPGLAIGINFLFTRKHYGFSFEPYMVINKYTEFGIRVNVLNLGKII